MKIRTGFVSNSSSSSFVLYGIRIEQEDLNSFILNNIPEEVLKAFEEANKEELSEYIGSREEKYDWTNSYPSISIKLICEVYLEGLSYAVSDECEVAYLGFDPRHLLDEETIGDLKEKAAPLETIFGQKPRWLVDYVTG